MITNEDIQGLLNQNSLNQQDAVNAGLLPARLNPAELETLMGSIPKYQVPSEPIKESRGARITEAIRRMGLAFQGIDPNVADLKRQELELRRMQLQQGKELSITEQIKQQQLNVLKQIQTYPGTFKERIEALKEEQPAMYGIYKNYIEKGDSFSIIQALIEGNFGSGNGYTIDLGDL